MNGEKKSLDKKINSKFRNETRTHVWEMSKGRSKVIMGWLQDLRLGGHFLAK